LSVSTRRAITPRSAKPGHRAAQHGGGGGAEFVVADLGVGGPAVVIEDDVDVPVSHQWVVVPAAGLAAVAVPVGAALLAAEEAPTAAGGDVAQLLHIGVQQLTGRGVLVAHHRLLAALQAGEPVDPAAAQHRAGGGRRHRGLGGQLHCAPALAQPQRHDPLRCGRIGLGRAGVGPAGAVGHPGFALGPVPLGPAVGGRPGDAEELRGPALGPVLLNDEPGQAETLAWGQRGISVEHEDLRCRGVVAFSSSTPRPEVLPSQDRSARSCDHTPSTNVSGQYT